MRLGVALWLCVMTGSSAIAFDTAPLPQTCKDTLAQMQSEKARFAQLGFMMARSRKAADIENFCKAARDTVLVIKGQSASLDNCVGDLAGAQAVPASSVDQLTQLKSIYKQMQTAAKDPKNDKYKCGLADL